MQFLISNFLEVIKIEYKNLKCPVCGSEGEFLIWNEKGETKEVIEFKCSRNIDHRFLITEIKHKRKISSEFIAWVRDSSDFVKEMTKRLKKLGHLEEWA